MENSTHRAYINIGNQLKTEIKQGIYTIGSRLPTEREISERFNVSRTIVREAIVMLEVEQLVTVKRGSGAYVTNLPSNNIAEKDTNLLNDVGPFELLQARQLIESGIAEFAAQQATKKDIVLLKTLLDEERALLEKDADDYSVDRKFHLALAEITQNDVLIKMQNDLWEYRFNSAMWAQLHLRILKNEHHRLWIIDHENILNAIQRKDPLLARKTMWQHLENVKVKLFELSDVEDPKFDGYLFNTNPIAVGI
ncbi:GntR family transcriptional regulator [Cricetibacter osteomyelitidis]|uniref:GntR family transcriptional regulator n=1 Tax=Cricetibacter osteomyelitidis TaxID=1521931 RepID=A0A4R2T110_9PAST|nr:FCD domain-containing protein [Cricetibacter osteomyelitidis]TCP96567.1 GntR family transcriptional regulator [Cricetibacter osteomyelitidis]